MQKTGKSVLLKVQSVTTSGIFGVFFCFFLFCGMGGNTVMLHEKKKVKYKSCR